jgi:arylsulfatase A-like enzyme
VNLYNFQQPLRNTFYGMMSVVDETVANVTAALKRRGMWNNTLLVWTTDNGSPVDVGGSNAPLKGGKGSNWGGCTQLLLVT